MPPTAPRRERFSRLCQTHTTFVWSTVYICCALAAGQGLPQLLQMDWLALSSWNMEKDGVELLSLREIIHSWYCWCLSDSAVLLGQPCSCRRDVLALAIPSCPAQLFHSCSPPGAPVLLCWTWELPWDKGDQPGWAETEQK